MEPKAPIVTQELVGGPLGERPTHSPEEQGTEEVPPRNPMNMVLLIHQTKGYRNHKHMLLTKDYSQMGKHPPLSPYLCLFGERKQNVEGEKFKA
jgi:hypothetical protein